MTATATSSRSPEDIQRITTSVKARFNVTHELYHEGGGMEFAIEESPLETKAKFLSLLDELRSSGDSAILRKSEDGEKILVVFRKPIVVRGRTLKPAILFGATIATILADGILRATGYTLSMVSLAEIALIYTASLMGIIGIHEMGHKIASWHHKMDSSWPYFIPGIPGIWPTMGAVISSREPPPNRDSLFDLGLSGPVAGLAVTLVVSVVAIYSSVLISPQTLQPGQTVAVDAYTNFLTSFIKGPGSNMVLTGGLFNLLYFAYSIGFLITFVNLLPAWQLDGGHIANSAVSPRVHRLLTFISVAAMFLMTAFFLMAILVLILSLRTPSLRPLDDVSPLSSGRKIMFGLTWILAAAIYVFVIFNNAYFGFSLLFH